MAQQDQQLRTLVDQFVSELTVLINQQALEAVREVLGDGSPRRGPGRPRKTASASRRSPGRPRKSGSSRKTGGKRLRRSPEDVASLAATVLAHVQSNPGQRLEEIGRELGHATKDLKRPITNLMEEGKLRTEGQKRGTKYFAGKGRASAKKATKKKAAKRKTTKRKSSKRGRKAA